MFSIWPSTQRTCNAMVAHLIKALSKQSILSKCYGTLPSDEASSAMRLIKTEAFSTAAASASIEDNGIEILQVYSREISRKMLDTVKTRASSATASSVVDAGTTPQTSSLKATSATAASEDNSPTVTESYSL